MRDLKKITHLDTELKEIGDLESATAQYSLSIDKLKENFVALETIRLQRENLANLIINEVEEIAKGGISETITIGNDTAILIKSSSTVMLMILTFVLILGVLFAMIITRSITRPLKLGVEFAKSVSNGD